MYYGIMIKWGDKTRQIIALRQSPELAEQSRQRMIEYALQRRNGERHAEVYRNGVMVRIEETVWNGNPA